MRALPTEIVYGKKTYMLSWEANDNNVQLIYQNKEDLNDDFLVGVISDTMRNAIKSMKHYLFEYQLI